VALALVYNKAAVLSALLLPCRSPHCALCVFEWLACCVAIQYSTLKGCLAFAGRLQSELVERDKQSAAAASALACKVGSPPCH